MVNIKPKTVITMKQEGVAASHSRTDMSIRGLPLIVDEPTERGGTNQGPSPTETLMGSLIACTNVIGHKVANMHGVEFSEMTIRLEAQFDRRGVTLVEEVDVPFPTVTLHIDVTTTADDAAMELVKRDLPRFCPISKVVSASGSKVTEIWTVKRP